MEQTEGIGDSLIESSQAAQQAYNELSALGAATHLPFLQEKTEIQHFSRDKLIDAIILKTKQSNSLCDKPRLAQSHQIRAICFVSAQRSV